MSSDDIKTTKGLSDSQDIMYRAICYAYFRMCKDFKIQHNKDVTIEHNILIHVVDRVLKEIVRAKSWHGIDADCHKISAYITYWICKFKPIRVINSNIYNVYPKFAYLFNEFLSVNVSIGRINQTNTFNLTKKAKETQTKFEQRVLHVNQMRLMLREFFYNLHYCNLSMDSLSLIYFYIDITAGNYEYIGIVLGKAI